MKTKLYSFISNTLAALHFLFIIYVLLGVILVKLYPVSVWLHIPCITWGFLVQYFDWPCPLTLAEKYFRRFTEIKVHDQGFIAHHLKGFIQTDRLNYILAGLVVTANAAGYLWLYFSA